MQSHLDDLRAMLTEAVLALRGAEKMLVDYGEVALRHERFAKMLEDANSAITLVAEHKANMGTQNPATKP